MIVSNLVHFLFIPDVSIVHFVIILVLDGNPDHLSDIASHILVHVEVEVVQILVGLQSVVTVDYRSHCVYCSRDLENVTPIIVQYFLHRAVVSRAEVPHIIYQLLIVALHVDHIIKCVGLKRQLIEFVPHRVNVFDYLVGIVAQYKEVLPEAVGANLNITLLVKALLESSDKPTDPTVNIRNL